MLLRCSFLLIAIFYCSVSYSQIKNEDELKKIAEKHFEEEEYGDAYKLYSQLVSLYPKDPEYNYRLGVCMLYTEPDKKKPYSYLQLACKSTDVPKDAKFYLAKTYHINYKFDEAIKLYEEYKKTASAASIKKLQVDREIMACRNGKRLLSNLSDLVVINKKQLNEADYFRSYDIKSIGGKLLVKPEDFKTGADKKKKEKSVIYLPRTGDRVYYSSYGEGGDHGRDIYYANKLPNGAWSKPTALPGNINSEYDEDYPFLHPNGKTLYFSSKGHNSMGGYDVFKTTFDETTNSWSKPVNLEFPINSPDDDILFVTDSLEKTAYFSTGRYSPYGKIDVLKINTERRPMNFAVIKGTVLKETATQSLKSKITVKNMENGEIVGSFQAGDNGDYNMELPNGGKFIFTVETPDIPTQSDAVQVPVAYTLKPYKQAISYENKKLKIINYFDGDVGDENYSMMIDLIEKKAKLEINETEPYNNNLKDAALKNNDNVSNNATGNVPAVTSTNPTPTTNDNKNVTTNKNISNDELLSMAKQDAKEAETEAAKLKQDAQDAFGLATQKTEEAAQKQKEADAALANANTITDVAKKNEELAKANELKEDATIASNVANTAANLAKKLEVDANQKQKEADLTNQYVKEIEAVTKNKNNKEALAKLEQIQKQLDEISNQKNQSDELVSSLKAESDLKQNELQKTEKKSADINNEINTIKNEVKTLETDLANESDKSLKENISAQIRELNNDVDLKNKDLAANNEKINNLKNEVEGINKEIEIANKILSNESIASNNNANNAAENNNAVANNNNVTNNSANNTSGTNKLTDLTQKYDAQISGTVNNSNNKEDIEKQNTILNAYNSDINSLIAENKTKLNASKNANEKKVLNQEIKDLEKIKSDNNQLIAANASKLNKLASENVAANNSTNNPDNNAANTETTAVAVTNNNANNATETNGSNINNNGNATNNPNNNNVANNNQNNEANINNASNNVNNNVAVNNTNNNPNSNAVAKNGNQDVIKPIALNTNTDKATVNKELNNLSSSLSNQSTKEASTFAFNDYKESSSNALKTDAAKKIEIAKQKEEELKQLINQTESNLNTTSNLQNAVALVNEAETLNNNAYDKRKEAATKTGAEKEALIKEAIEIEKNAVSKKMEASTAQQSQNKSQFENNNTNLAELQKLSASKSNNEISQANLLADEAAINFKQAQKMRDEANTYPTDAAKLGGLSNAEEKENEALFKQQKAIELLAKNNPDYKLKSANDTENPAANVAAINNEIAKTNQAQFEAYTALSKANQNELKLQSDKASKNPAFKNPANKEALALKTTSDNLNKEAKSLIAQSATAKTVAEKSSLLLKANEKEIEALKTLNQANELLNNPNAIVSNNANTEPNNAVTNNAAVNNNTVVASNNNINTNEPTNNNQNNVSAVETNTVASANNQNNNAATETNTVTASNNQNNNATENNNNVAVNNNETNAAASRSTSVNPDNNATAVNTTTNTESNNAANNAVTNSNASVASNTINPNQPVTSFNAYSDNEAAQLKAQALAKMNAAASTNNASNSNETVSSATQIVTSLVTESEQLSNQAFALRKEAATKTGPEKEQAINQAKELEKQAASKKVEAANKQEQINTAIYNANKQSLDDLAKMAQGKNIAELNNAEQQLAEANTQYTQAQNLRTEADALPNDGAKLGGYSNADEKENLAIAKQKALLDVYQKYFSNYVLKEPNLTLGGGDDAGTQQYNEGLTLLAQANQKEYQSRFTNLPGNLTTEQATLKTQAQEAYTTQQNLLSKANSTTDQNEKKQVLTEANQKGQLAIDLLNKISSKPNAVVSNNPVATNNTNGNANNNPTTNSQPKNNTANNPSNPTNVGNNPATNNAANNNASVIKVEGLDIKTTNAYSASKPIPIDEKIPDGLIFKVQIGAFKTPLPNNTFKGLSPIIAQTTPSGYIRYMAGDFNKYESANAVKNDLRSLGYNDAFVVVYYNGVRITIAEAMEKLKAQGQTIDLAAATNASAGLTKNTNIPKNTIAPATNNVATNNTAANNQPAEVTKELEQMNGLLYTVQIGVFSKQTTKAQLLGLKPIYTEKLPNGLYRYTAGIYNQSSKLLEDKRKVIDLGVKDAFVSAYYNAKRIPFSEGQKLQAENNNLKMEAENPIVFPGVNAATTSANEPVITLVNEPVNNNVQNNEPVITLVNEVKPFSNGVTNGPEPTADNGVKADETGISFKVQIGAYKNQVPNDVASKFLNIKTWPVKNNTINGLYIYTIGNFTNVSFAKKLKDEAIALGITDAFITVYKDGKKLYGAEATELLSK